MTKETINVVVIEDDEYYNNLISNALHQSVSHLLIKGKFRLVVRSFTDAAEYIRKIKSGELLCDHSVVFIDYYLGHGITGAHVLKVLKEIAGDIVIILISQSKTVREKIHELPYDYFVVKDRFAPALCSLYLQQYVENKYSVSLNK